jgi:hypothetical protein
MAVDCDSYSAPGPFAHKGKNKQTITLDESLICRIDRAHRKWATLDVGHAASRLFH